MAVYEFGSIIAFRTESGTTEQFGTSDYRFELIKKETDSEKKLRIARHEYISDLDKTLSYLDGKFYTSLGFEIPVELFSLSSLNLGDSSYIKAYINAYITEIKKRDEFNPDGVLEWLYGTVPFFDDGSVMVKKDLKTFNQLKKMYWPNISSGVEKKLKNTLRESMNRLALFAIGFMYGDLNPNSQLQIMDHWSGSIRPTYEQLDQLKENLDSIFQLYGRTEFITKAKKDNMWVEHVNTIIRSMLLIKEAIPDYVCPTSYNLNETVAIINSARTKLTKLPVPFKLFWHKYSFFHGLEYEGYRLYIPKDNFELSDFGSAMHLCIGDDRYTDYLKGEDQFLAIIFKDENLYACAHFEIAKEKEIQFLKKDNKYFCADKSDTNKDDEYKLLLPWIKDIVSLEPHRVRKYITKSFAVNKLRDLRDSMTNQEFKQISNSFGLDVATIFSDKPVIDNSLPKIKDLPMFEDAMSLTETASGVAL